MNDKPDPQQVAAMHREWVLCRARMTQSARALEDSAEKLIEALVRLKGISKDVITRLAMIAVDSRCHPSKYEKRAQ